MKLTNWSQATGDIPLSQLRSLFALVLIVGLGLAVRLPGLGDRGFWFDEAYTWRMAQYPTEEILFRLQYDNSPPLHYLLVRLCLSVFGESAAALRSISVVAGVAAIVGMWGCVRALLTGPLADSSRVRWQEIVWAPLLTAALVALSPMQIRYSIECRMYELGVMFAAFGTWAMVRAMDPTQVRWGRWLLYALVTSLFLYTHAFATLTIATQAFVIGWWLMESSGGSIRRAVRQPNFLPVVAAFGLVAVEFLPWVPTLLQQASAMLGLGWIPPLKSYDRVFGLIFQLVAFDPSRDASAFAASRMTVVVLIVVAAAIWRSRWADGIPLALFIGPLLMTIGLCLVGKEVFIDRYLIFAQPFLLALFALAIARLRNPALLTLAGLTAITISAYWCADAWDRMDLANHSGHRGAAQRINDNRSPADVILCCSGNAYFPISYHLSNRDNAFAVAHVQGWVAAEWALDKPREIISPSDIDHIRTDRVWVVNHERDGQNSQTVPVPARWRQVSRVAYPDVFRMETVVVTEYLLRSGN